MELSEKNAGVPGREAPGQPALSGVYTPAPVAEIRLGIVFV